MQRLSKNVATNLHHGAQRCAAVRECRDVGDGIAQGDFKQVTLNAALLSSYLVPLAGAPSTSGIKVGINSAAKQGLVAQVAALSTMHSTLKNGTKD